MHTPAIETPLPPSPGAKPLHLKALDFSVLTQRIHCGMCLPTCPTYDATKLEHHSPRGRIQLMKNIAEGNLDVTKTFGDEMYFCLGCLACETACSDVEVAHSITLFARAYRATKPERFSCERARGAPLSAGIGGQDARRPHRLEACVPFASARFNCIVPAKQV